MIKKIITGYFAASYLAATFVFGTLSGFLSALFMMLGSLYFLLSAAGRISPEFDIKTWKSALAIGFGGMLVGVILMLASQNSQSPVLIVLVIVCTSIYLAFEAYSFMYFGGSEFAKIKGEISKHVADCNDLNSHIEELKSSYVNIKSYNYGQGELHDNSKYAFKRSEWKKFSQDSRTHNCSASVLNNVRNQPIKYLCKYFDIQQTEESLSAIEGVLNAFSAAEQGKELLTSERDSIVESIIHSVPWIIKAFARGRLLRKLGFKSIDLTDLYFPVYKFQYVSSGGNSSANFAIKLDIQNLEQLIQYIGDLIKFRKSIQGQRALMTTRLREQVKIRDNFACQSCGLSVEDEPNLLLEIDHIHPVSKGGITSMDNLQTLCWRCNRSKGAKVQMQ